MFAVIANVSKSVGHNASTKNLDSPKTPLVFPSYSPILPTLPKASPLVCAIQQRHGSSLALLRIRSRKENKYSDWQLEKIRMFSFMFLSFLVLVAVLLDTSVKYLSRDISPKKPNLLFPKLWCLPCAFLLSGGPVRDMWPSMHSLWPKNKGTQRPATSKVQTVFITTRRLSTCIC